jgi:hypothetical protein
VSISSVLSPTALASQVLGSSPLGAAASSAGNFIDTLLQTLRQAGTASPSSGATGSTTATATAAGAGATASMGTLQAHGHRHGRHGGGMDQLAQLLQQTQPAASGTAVAQPALQSLLQSLHARAATAPGQLLNTAV